MGTHPIFESDFDCLTDKSLCTKMNEPDDEPLLGHQEVIARQDQGLDDLAKIIRRQREIGITIGTEVDQQNEIIDDVTHLAETARGRLNHNTSQVDTILRRDKGNCALWLVVIALFIAIVILLSV